jgi:hypothetical protein
MAPGESSAEHVALPKERFIHHLVIGSMLKMVPFYFKFGAELTDYTYENISKRVCPINVINRKQITQA